MINSFELYRRMAKDDIILAFRGDVTDELLESVIQVMEARMEETPAEVRLKKKVNHILVECLQNVYHHRVVPVADELPDEEGSSIFLICRDKSGQFKITTGNLVLNSETNKLKERIDSVNSLTQEELKTYYRDKLESTTLSAKGGAGLGIIDMARKSGNKIDYAFDKLNDRVSFFTLVISIS